MTHLHIVRQPVFFKNKTVYAYELLYQRSSADAQAADADAESLRVLTAGFLSADIDTLTGGKPAVIGLTEYLLTKGMATLFPKEQLLVGLDKKIRPSGAVLESLRELKKNGYTLVLDGGSERPEWSTLIGPSDIVRLDFAADGEERGKAVKRHAGKPVQLLAHGIENERQLQEACKAGCSLFQGYYFMKPASLSVTTVPVSRLNLMLLLKELVRTEPDIEHIRADIEMDVGLTYDILKLVNSAYFYKSNKIGSIRKALAYLGLQGIKKWAMMSALARQTVLNNEAVELSMIRSRFMEQLGMLFVYGSKVEDYTLTGLFSLLETLTGCPYSLLFEKIPVSEEVYAVLAQGKRDSLMGRCFRLVEEYEKGNFIEADHIARQLDFTFDQVEAMYRISLRWLNANRAGQYE